MLSVRLALLVFLVVALASSLVVAQTQGQFDELLDSLVGTWSTGSGGVRTGPVSFSPIPHLGHPWNDGVKLMTG